MSIVIPEKIIKEQLEIMIRFIYDDVVAKETLGAVTDAVDVDAGVTPTVTTQGTVGTGEVTSIVFPVATEIGGKHWFLSTPSKGYFVWYQTGSNTQPEVFDRSPITVAVNTTDTAIEVAQATQAQLAKIQDDGVAVFKVPTTTTDTIVVTNCETNAERRSLLWQIFGGIRFDNMDYFKQVRGIIKDKFEGEKRKLNIHLGFSEDRKNFPVISILLPNEENEPKFTGVVQSQRNYFDGTFSDQLEHDYQVTYNLLITSDNENDVTFIYQFIKTLILMGHQQFVQNGFKNPWVSGRDITMDFELMPMPTYHRTVAFSFFYRNEVPELYDTLTVDSINFTGTPSVG